MGLSNYVYPGATHSRFAHALGALHLMTTAVNILRSKSIEITEQEYLATSIAILLHDIGHGPFSHALERVIIEKEHEQISIDLMHALSDIYPDHFELAIDIFEGRYKKKFLTQLVSSQLDMDRMDYLTRDSYYSGVAEGVIGYKRIISMLNVADNQLVVEEKALYSIEKFIVARHIMYWQVYLHKASLGIEQMLKSYVTRLRSLLRQGKEKQDGSILHNILSQTTISENYLEDFVRLDDVDIFFELKNANKRQDEILRYLGQSIIDRKLFTVKLYNEEPDAASVERIIDQLTQNLNIDRSLAKDLVIKGQESNKAYDLSNEEILLVRKNGDIIPVSDIMDISVKSQTITKYFIMFPKA